MAPRNPVIIEPPQRARLADFAGAKFDDADMSKASRAVAQVLTRYPTLMADEVAKVRAAWKAAPRELTAESVAETFKVAHDLAGCGETFDYPLVTVLARSLCRLFKQGDLKRPEMREVVEAHIAALQAVVRDNVRGHGGDVGLALAAELDRAITKFELGSSTHRPNRLHQEVSALQPKPKSEEDRQE